jgi:hypothetical protein
MRLLVRGHWPLASKKWLDHTGKRRKKTIAPRSREEYEGLFRRHVALLLAADFREDMAASRCELGLTTGLDATGGSEGMACAIPIIT